MAEKSKKPAIRFAGFTEAWEQRKLEEIIQECNVRTSDFRNNPLYSLTIENGVTPKTERYERSSLVIKTEDLFKVVKPNVFVTNPMNLRFGALGYNKNTFNVAVSGYYDVFSIDDNNCSGFWNSYFKTPKSIKIFDDVATGSLIEKRRVKYSTLQQLELYMPKDLDEKIQIGSYMNQIDNLITLHQRKYDKLVNVKKAMLEKMFPKDGSDVPEIRFKGFTEAWEQRKLGELSSAFEYGLNAASKEFDGKNKYIRITDIDDDSHDFNQKDITSPDIDLSNADNFKLKEGDILFARTGASVGKTYIYKSSHGLVYYAGFLIRARIKEEYNPEFVFQNTLTKGYQKFIKVTSMRSGQPGINALEYYQFESMVPEKAEQSKIGKYFRLLDNLITLHQRKLEKLKNLKKACLEKMFV